VAVEEREGAAWGSWAGYWAEPAHAGRREEEEGSGLGPTGLAAFFSSSFLFSFPTLKLFKQFYLDSNKFEFKPYTLNTNKTMHQRECTNKLIL
jgi:hypothetical protein